MMIIHTTHLSRGYWLSTSFILVMAEISLWSAESIPHDHELLGGGAITSGGVRLLLLADLLGRIKADLRQKLVTHGEIGIDLNRFAQNFDRLFLLHPVEVQVKGRFDQAVRLGRLGGKRKSCGDSIGCLRSGWLCDACNGRENRPMEMVSPAEDVDLKIGALRII